MARLKDAGNAALALESRFDLAYNTAHALCLAALRWHVLRSLRCSDNGIAALLTHFLPTPPRALACSCCASSVSL